jgi:hypothetical protein
MDQSSAALSAPRMKPDRAVISTAVAGITYLWLYLRGSRMRVLTLELEQSFAVGAGV